MDIHFKDVGVSNVNIPYLKYCEKQTFIQNCLVKILLMLTYVTCLEQTSHDNEFFISI